MKIKNLPSEVLLLIMPCSTFPPFSQVLTFVTVLLHTVNSKSSS
jgi:hypothetical protein